MGRLRPNTVASQTLRATSRPPASGPAGTTPKRRSVVGGDVVLEHDGEKVTYKLLSGIDTFLHYVIERHKAFERRYAGKLGPWTDDPILQMARFTNNFRILDRDTQYILVAVIPGGSSNFKECVFRVLLFRLFDRIETYEFLRDEVGPLTWKGFNREAYVEALDRRVAARYSIVGHAYQMPSPTPKTIGGASHHDRILRLLELMMLSGFADDLSECYELCDMQAKIALYPSMRAFLGYQVILDLNMIPALMVPEDWALPGPGAVSGLRMILGKSLRGEHIGPALSWMHEHFDELAFAAGYTKKDIPALKPSMPGLSIVDIEHVLCEFSKYVKIKSPASYNYRSFGLHMANPKVTRILPKNWKLARVAFMERNRKYTNPHASKSGEYVVSAILDKGMCERALHYKIRWEGWGPDADTWEPAAKLAEEVPDMVKAFEKKLAVIEDLLKKYRLNKI